MRRRAPSGGWSAGTGFPLWQMTANAMADDRQRCLEAAMDDFLTKPVSKRRLYDLLEGLRAPAEDELVGGRLSGCVTIAVNSIIACD